MNNEENFMKPIAATPEQLEKLYPGISKKTLANLRSQGKGGPLFYKKMNRIFYRLEDFEAWLFSEQLQSTGRAEETGR